MLFRSSLLLLTIFCASLTETVQAQPLTYFVDSGRADDTGNGQSWQSAKKTIQAALDCTTTAHQVWVKAGIYSEAITLRSGMQLLGGFSGNENQTADRNIKANPTVIDASKARIGGFPAYHVVTLNKISSASLDGFTLRGGNASGYSSLDSRGAGVLCADLTGECRISRCVVTGCSATDGGGICSVGNFPLVLSDCTIACNSADYGGGLEIYNNDRVPLIQNCMISGNKARLEGGGVYCLNAAATFQNCIVSGNLGGEGGGFALYHSYNAMIYNCAIVGNQASSYGSAFGCIAGTSPDIRNCIIAGNRGAAVSCYRDDDYYYGRISLTRCLFHDNPDGDYLGVNYVIYRGALAVNVNASGARLNIDGDPRFKMGAAGHWTSAPQLDSVRGGAVLCDATAHWTPGALAGQFINPNTNQCRQALILDNTTTTLLVHSDFMSSVKIGDAWQMVDYHLTPGSSALDHGLVADAPLQDLDGEARPGTDGAVDTGPDEADPSWTPHEHALLPASYLKARPPVSYTPTFSIPFGAVATDQPLQELRLYYRRNRGPWTRYPSTFSPLTTAGGSFMFDTTLTGGDGDYELYTQVVDAVGNVEVPPAKPTGDVVVLTGNLAASRLYVDQAAPGMGTGANWNDACHSIGAALLLAAKFGAKEVWVAAGSYDEAVAMPGGVALYGGFSGYGGAKETSLSQRQTAVNATIIITSSTRVDQVVNRRVVTMDSITSSRLDGFTITGGHPVTFTDGSTSGIYGNNLNGSNVIANCVITRNQSAGGAGIYLMNASPLITDCVVSTNTGSSGAGGLNLELSSPRLTNCVITGNVGWDDSGGLYLFQSSPKFTGCTISENVCHASVGYPTGGGLCAVYNSAVELTNCIIRGNDYRFGAGATVSQSTALFQDCVITGNTGHGIFVDRSTATLTSCTISANTTVDGGAGVYSTESSLTFQNCMINKNIAHLYGGGMELQGTGTINLLNSRILGNQSDSYGGGAYITCTKLVTKNSIFAGNAARDGGGAYLGATQLTTSECCFSGNTARMDGGGLMLGGNATLQNCLLSGNQAGGLGGGMSFVGFTGTLTHCTIADNIAVTSAGGTYVAPLISAFAIQNSIFSGNQPEEILDCSRKQVLQLANDLLVDNPAGVFANLTLRKLASAEQLGMFYPNATGLLGGDPRFVINGPSAVGGTWNAPPRYDATTNQTILPASGPLIPGAFAGRLLNPDTRQLRQAYINDNSTTCILAAGDLTALAHGDDHWKLVDYHLLSGSDALDRARIAGAPPIDLDNDPRPGSDGLVDIGVDEADPAFLPALDSRPPASMVINTPSFCNAAQFNVPVVAFDCLSGVSRVELFYRRDGGPWTHYGDAVTSFTTNPIPFDTTRTGGDGFYEFYTVATDNAGNIEPAPAVADDSTDVVTRYPNDRLFVDSTARGSGSGKDWPNACARINDALALASACGGREIWVARGTYAESLTLPSGMALYGGFEGAGGARETSLIQRDPARNVTTVSSSASHVIVMQGITNSRLDGFTIRDGQAWSNSGGGIYCRNVNGSNVIARCRVTANISSTLSGGIYCTSSSLVIDGCTIQANGNAGIACDSGSTQASSAAQSPVIRNCMIAGNVTAGIYCSLASPAITNCLITGNSYGVQCAAASPAIVNCTLVENDVAVHCSTGAAPSICNTLVASNNYGVYEADKTEDPTITYSLFHDNPQADYLDANTTRTFGAQAISQIVRGARGIIDGAPRFLNDGARITSGTWRIANQTYSGNTEYYITLYDFNARLKPQSLAGRMLNANLAQRRTLAIVNNTTTSLDVTASIPTNLAGKPWGLRDRDDFRPGCGSAAIDAGTSVSVGLLLPMTDLDGKPRPAVSAGSGSGCYDIGAYETQSAGRPRLVIMAPSRSLAFGEWNPAYGATAPDLLVIGNYGDAPILFSGPGVQISGPDAACFKFTAPPLTTTLDPGTTRALSLIFEPGALGSKQATLTLTTNDPDEPVATLALSGTSSVAPPAITLQPASQTVDPGRLVQFSLAATGAQPMSYRWSRNGLDLTDDGRISGAATHELTIRNATTADAGAYVCRLANDSGSAVSTSARLTVNPTLVVVSPLGTPTPPVGANVYTTGSLVFASLSFTNLVYYDTPRTTRDLYSYWLKTGSPATSGTGNSTYFTMDRDTTLTWCWKRQYQLKINVSPAGAGWVSLGTGSTNANGAWLDAGGTATLQARPYYGFYVAGWSGDVSGKATTTTLQLTAPGTVNITFSRKPSVLVQPVPLSVDPGTSASFTITAGGDGPFGYRWKKDGIALVDDSRTRGAAMANLRINPVQAGDGGVYSCDVFNGGGSATSLGARLIINPTLTIISAHGTPLPVAGTRAYTSGTLVNFSMSGSPETDTSGTTRWVCTGWTLSGLSPVSGIGLSGNARLDQTATLTWTWKKQYRLTTSAYPAGGGGVMLVEGQTPADGWYDEGQIVDLCAVPRAGYQFTAWEGALGGQGDRISVLMDRPQMMQARFRDLRNGIKGWILFSARTG